MKLILSGRRRVLFGIVMSITAVYWIFAVMQLMILLNQ